VTWQVQFTGLAVDDVADAFAWYAASRSGLGEEFLADLGRVIALIEQSPEATQLKRPVTIRLNEFTVEYFKTMAAETEIPYQTLINLYLRECAGTGRRLAMQWRNAKREVA